MATVFLPSSDGPSPVLRLREPASLTTASTPSRSRTVYAAAHVVADPRVACAAAAPDGIDWEATLQLRRRIWALGLGVAESMDTAQRGMGLTWDVARELALRSIAESRRIGGTVVVGIGTDQLTGPVSLDQIRDAYVEQIATIEDAGGEVVMMASRDLARVAQTPSDYVRVYEQVLTTARRPVILHWLGQCFDPALQGYWGFDEPKDAMDVVADLIANHADTVRGIKVSLLDPALEVQLRERIPAPARVFTGDDYHYTDLIAGDGRSNSDALLGAFAAIAPYASAAFARLDAGDEQGFRDILAPTEPLSRLIFAAPTQYYKVGVAWLAYLNGEQSHFRMLDGFEAGRSLAHLGQLIHAADNIGLFSDPDFTAQRARAYFAVHGIGA
ncbi:dihydrodipicolinate synthase family protein (plasmid) [Mycobacterium sp. djl-10]|nr:dihydrodipicolinate synthase family protein [Mycobacterium sp. djl-10]